MITSSPPAAADDSPRATRRAAALALPARVLPTRPLPGWAPDAAAAAAVGGVALALYARTLLPGIGYSGDTAKWQFLGAVGGTPHPTGYPLYLAIDKAWVSLFRLGSLAWRVNLLSALFGAATVAALVLLLRTLGARRSVAAATAATFAATVTFWSQAVVAEVYTLHLLLLTTVTLCLARWRAGASDRWLRAGLAVLALSFGNHLGTALALPGVAWLLWSDRRRAFTARNVAWAVGAAAVGAAQYGYLLWMADVGRYAEQPVEGLSGVLDMVTGGRFRDAMFTFGPRELVDDRLPMFARLAWREVSLLALPAAYGAWRALRSRGPQRDVAVHLLALAAAATLYALEFDAEDVFVFFLPLWLVTAVFLGLGAEAVAEWAGARLWGAGGRWRRAVAVAVLVAVPVGMAATNYGRADRSDDVADAGRIERLVEAAGTDAVLVTDNYADSEYVWYYLLGEDMGRERRLSLANQIAPDTVAAYLRGGSLRGIARPGLPVYTATPHQAQELRALGLTVTPVAADVWRVAA
jgi:hypothetical protein